MFCISVFDIREVGFMSTLQQEKPKAITQFIKRTHFSGTEKNPDHMLGFGSKPIQCFDITVEM